MEKFTVKLGISTLTATTLVEKGRNVHDSILGNVDYPTLQTLLPALATACNDLEDANQAMEFNGGKVSSNNKRVAEVALRSMLKDFGGYVQGISEGDKKLILSAAFDVAKDRKPLPPPLAPGELKVSRSAIAGLLKVRWKKVHGAVLYYLEMLVEGSTEWTRVLTTTRTSHDMTDLETGKEYSFRVQAIASSGISPMSEEVTQKAA
ncbi:MAG: fibronectin type III domain-containing protein [Flavobacteriales bacterium]